jgi:hypothetical protein
MDKTWAVYPWKLEMEEGFSARSEEGGGLMRMAGHVRSCRAVRASKRGVHQLMGC